MEVTEGEGKNQRGREERMGKMEEADEGEKEKIEKGRVQFFPTILGNSGKTSNKILAAFGRVYCSFPLFDSIIPIEFLILYSCIYLVEN